MALLKFWPFNRPKPVSFRETVRSMPPAPCGKQYDHYYWTELEGFPCPTCAAMELRRREAEAEDRLAEKIAARVHALATTKGQQQ